MTELERAGEEMSRNLYDLMNWPEIEGIVYSECDDPCALLGGHLCKDGFLIQVFRPDAVEIEVQLEGRAKAYPMEKVDEAGFYAVLLPFKKKMRYQITMENLKGRRDTYTDPYLFAPQLKKADVKKFESGACRDAYRFMGSHMMTIDGVSGMHFAVWAPNARRVSVVGDFNGWDGRIFQMQKNAESGIFELFVPGLKAEERYNYEVKLRDGRIQLKADPFMQGAECGRRFASVAGVSAEFAWTDASWMEKKQKMSAKGRPMSVCELDAEALRQKDIVQRVAALGFNYVELMPVCAHMGERPVYETIGYFAPQDAIGITALQQLVNDFHGNGIGVLMDWNAAFMGNNPQGLSAFDGTPLYETDRARLDHHPDLQVSTFDYAKPQVRSFLLSSMNFWASCFHIDGFRIDEVASMLYLDYGRNAGEWLPNMYGGNENLAAIEFLQQLRVTADRVLPGTLLIAEETSGWPKVTGTVKEGALGFDYKWNDGWKKEFLPFMEMDPLFRKGIYGRLTYSMLYQYSEDFMLEFSHEDFKGEADSLYERMPGSAEDEKSCKKNKQGNVRAALGYLYTHPGKKMVNYYECVDCSEYMAALNRLYLENTALYELDNYSEGFEWIDNVSAKETVLSFVRRADDGTELLTVLNFTPVKREDFRLGVTRAGKYRMIFNSDDKLYGGETDVRGKQPLYCSEETPWNGKSNSIEVTLPPLGMAIYSYEPYSFVELEEIRIRREAAVAKEKAEAQARAAQELKEKAEAEAKLAMEAEERAKAAAEAALKAKLDAEQKAEEALQTSLKIDEETRKKLSELRAGKAEKKEK